MKKYKDIKTKLLKNRDIKREYDALNPQFQIIKSIIKKRMEKDVSQKELASIMGTKQSAISRFESGEYNPTISFLQKITKALDTDIKITVK